MEPNLLSFLRNWVAGGVRIFSGNETCRIIPYDLCVLRVSLCTFVHSGIEKATKNRRTTCSIETLNLSSYAFLSCITRYIDLSRYVAARRRRRNVNHEPTFSPLTRPLSLLRDCKSSGSSFRCTRRKGDEMEAHEKLGKRCRNVSLIYLYRKFHAKWRNFQFERKTSSKLCFFEIGIKIFYFFSSKLKNQGKFVCKLCPAILFSIK